MNMIKVWCTLFVISLYLMLFGITVNASERVVTFGVDSDFPPFSFIANNTPQGYELDLIKLIFEKGDYKLEFKYGDPWGEIYIQTVNNRMDICGTLVRTPERAEQVIFTDDAYTRYYGIFINGNSVKIDINDMGKYRLGAVKGYFSEVIVRDRIKSSNYEVFDTYLKMITALKENRIDAFIETTEVVKYYISKNNLVGQVVLQHDGLFPQSVPFGISKSRTDLVEFINKRLKEIKASGEYEVLYIKNFSTHSSDYYAAQKRMHMWIMTGLVVSALFFIILLKIQVKRATSKIIQRELEIKLKNEELEAVNEELNQTLEEMEAANEELISTGEILRESEERHRSILQTAMDGFWRVNIDGHLLEVNDSYCQMSGYTKQELLTLNISDLEARETLDEVAIHMKRLTAEGEDRFETRHRRKDGSTFPVEVSVQYKSDGNGFIVVFVRDITERSLAEKALKEKERLLSSFIKHSPVYTFIKEVNSLESRVLFASDNYIDMIGLSGSEMADKTMFELFPPELAEKFTADDWTVVSSGEILKFDEDLNERHYTTIKFTIPQGERLLLAGYTIDITDIKNADENIRNLLREKELLLQEVHHRIKNNMNTIKGLLTLQIAAEDNPSAAASLRDAESRVQSMIMLYDRLYSTDNFLELSVKEYLQPLTGEIVGSFPNSAKVKIETDIEDFVLNVQTLSPLGIIINELLTNMMKYAFTGRDSGVIKVSASVKDNMAVVCVQDNGVGMPDAIDFKNSTGFGLELVNMLVTQIGGSIRIERGEGTRFVLEFTV